MRGKNQIKDLLPLKVRIYLISAVADKEKMKQCDCRNKSEEHDVEYDINVRKNN